MQRITGLLVGLLLSAAASAAITYTPGPVKLHRAGVFQANYPDFAACDAALRAQPVTSGQVKFRCFQDTIAKFVANPPAPVDCVVSDWGAWSPGPWSACSAGSRSRTETRSRVVVVAPSGGGAACPALTETQTVTQSCGTPPPGDGPDAPNPQNASSYPHVISCNTSACLAATQSPAAGGLRQHVPGAAWNGGGAVRFAMGTSGQSYAGFRNIQLKPSSRINLRFVYVMGTAFLNDDAGLGPKHIILVGANNENRFIAQQHSYATNGWDLGLGNGISPQYPPRPPLWDYGQHLGEPISFEFEAVQGGNYRVWITKRSGSFNETLLPVTVPVTVSGPWTILDVLGAFGGPQIQGASNPNAYFQISNLVISDRYIGPPAGFRP